MVAGLTLLFLALLCFAASALSQALQRRIYVFRFTQLERDMLSRWARLDLAAKVELLRRMSGRPVAPVRPEAELDSTFREHVGRAWRRMRLRHSLDLDWLSEGLSSAGV